MNKSYVRLIACLLVPVISLDPVAAAVYSFGAQPICSPRAVIRSSPLRATFQEQALNAASDFILSPPLLARRYSSRAHRLDPVLYHVVSFGYLGWNTLAYATGWIPSLDKLLFGASLRGVSFSGVGMALPTWASLFIVAIIASFWWRGRGRNANLSDEVRLEHRQHDQDVLWGKFTRLSVLNVRSKVRRVEEISLYGNFMKTPEMWYGPREFPSLQNFSYQLIGNLLAELEEGRHLSSTDAMRVVRTLLTLLSKSHPFSLTYRVMEFEDTGGTSVNIWTYSMPDPHRLKSMLIALQLGRTAFTDLSDAAITREIETALAAGRSAPPAAFRDVLTKGFPTLPASSIERKAMLRDYLLWLAEEPASLFDVSKIDHILDEPGFVESLKDKPQALIVDPLSFDPVTQKVDRVGVLPRMLARRIGAVQYSGTVVVQLDVHEDRRQRMLLMFVRPEDRHQGTTLSFSGVLDFEPGVSIDTQLKTMVTQYLGFEPDYDLLSELPAGANKDEYWESVSSLNAQVYNGVKGEDLQYRETRIIRPTARVLEGIDQNILALETRKTKYEEPAEYERDELMGRKRMRAMVKISVEDLLTLASMTHHAIQAGRPLGPDEKYLLRETYKGGREIETFIPLNPDDVVPYLKENSEGRDRLIRGRKETQKYFQRQLDAIKLARKEGTATYALSIDHNASMYDTHVVFQTWREYFRYIADLGISFRNAMAKLKFGQVQTIERDASSGQFEIPVGNTQPLFTAVRNMQTLMGAQAAQLDRVDKIHLLSGPFDENALPSGLRGRHAVEQMAGVLIVREDLGDGHYALWVHEDSLALVHPYLTGPLSTDLSRALVAYTLLFHEHTQDHSDRQVIITVRARQLAAILHKVPADEYTKFQNIPVKHQDLVDYGATFEALVRSFETGEATAFLRRINNPETGLNWTSLLPGFAVRRNILAHITEGVITDREQIRIANLLLEIGMDHLFAHWPAPYLDDDQKREFLEQVVSVDHGYPGGLKAYHQNTMKLIAELKAGRSRFSGKVPLLPSVIDIDDLKGAENPKSPLRQLERGGIARANKVAIVLVAGGLGTRLGYPGIKIDIPVSLLSENTYFDWYVKSIVEMQRRSNSIQGTDDRIPFFIMTSEETDHGTKALLVSRQYERVPTMESGKGETYWQKDDSVVILAKQSPVPSIDMNGSFHLDPENPFRLRTQPHGHGDVHILIHQTGLAKRWKAEDRTHIVFMQDTNAQLPNVLAAAIEATSQKKAGMTFVAIPRNAGDNIGLIAQLGDVNVLQSVLAEHHIKFSPQQTITSLFAAAQAQGLNSDQLREAVLAKSQDQKAPSSVANVEYAIAKPALQASVHKDGDYNDPVLNRSPYPGNVNLLIVDEDPYLLALEQTQGLMPEFVNFKDPITRLETNMQDISEQISRMGHAILVVRFANANGFAFSTVKNSLQKGAVAQAEGRMPETMSMAESDFYATMRNRLEIAGVRFDSQGGERVVAGIKVRDGAKVVLMPNFAPSMDELMDKVHGGLISDRSTLILDGENIAVNDLTLDGTLKVVAGPEVRLDIEHFTEKNGAEDQLVTASPGAAPMHVVRGYEFKRAFSSAARNIEIYEPGHYRLGPLGYVEVKSAPGIWVRVPDRIGTPEISHRYANSSRYSRRRVAIFMGVLGAAISLGVVMHLAAPWWLIWSLPQMFKLSSLFATQDAHVNLATGEMHAETPDQWLHETTSWIAGGIRDEFRHETVMETIVTPVMFWVMPLVFLLSVAKWIVTTFLRRLPPLKSVRFEARFMASA